MEKLFGLGNSVYTQYFSEKLLDDLKSISKEVSFLQFLEIVSNIVDFLSNNDNLTLICEQTFEYCLNTDREDDTDNVASLTLDYIRENGERGHVTLFLYDV